MEGNAVELVESETLKCRAEVKFVTANRLTALGQHRAEAILQLLKSACSGIVFVGETGCGTGQRQERQLCSNGGIQRGKIRLESGIEMGSMRRIRKR